MMAWRLYTPWRQPYQFAYFDRAWNVAHFDSNWPTLKLEKKFVSASPKPKLENYESVQHGLQFSGIKKGAKISFHRHFKDLYKQYRCPFWSKPFIWLIPNGNENTTSLKKSAFHPWSALCILLRSAVWVLYTCQLYNNAMVAYGCHRKINNCL